MASNKRAALGAGYFLLDDPRHRPEAVVRCLAAPRRRCPLWPGLRLSARQRMVPARQGYRYAPLLPASGCSGARDEIPATYELASPVSHVHPGCPPTLLIQGTLDCLTPVTAARGLHHRLVECGVPAINIRYPLTNHAFDLLLPQVSTPAQAALYYTERFLALMV